MRLHCLFASCRSCARCFLGTNAKFEPGLVKQNFCRSIWTVCTTCMIALLPCVMTVKKPGRSRGNIPKQRKIIKNWLHNAYVKRPNRHNTLKSANSSNIFGHRPLLTLINDSLSSNFLGIFLSSYWICVQSRKKQWPRCVKISCQKKSAPRKSPECWPLTFWPKVRHVAPSFHLPLEYEVRSHWNHS